MYRFITILGCVILSFSAFGQGEIDSVPRSSVRNEYTFEGSIYANGWGLGFSFGKMINIRKKHLYSSDFAVIKDFKEEKVTNSYIRGGGRFVYGKENSFLVWRFSYGQLFRLYEKKDKRGVEIRWFYKIGATLGFAKPIYYKFIDNNQIVVGKFSETPMQVSIADIHGRASFFKGFKEINIVPGVHGKVALSFEFGKKDLKIRALESGVVVDFFPKKIEIMVNDYNKLYFFSVFLSARFGYIKNPRLKHIDKKNNLLN